MRPDSKLFIIPARGGEAREMRCNLSLMNSWHSWSPNSRWLVFSSKARSPYTQLFLTHIDAAGRSSPPVVLDHFTASERAANIPEFVNARPGAIKRIRHRFLDVESYLRAAYYALLFDDFDAAERAYRVVLEFDPNETRAHNELGVVLVAQSRFDEAEAHFAKAIELDPEFAAAHRNLGTARGRQGNYQQAIAPLREALRINPDDPDGHQMLGKTLTGLGRVEEGKAHLDEAIRLQYADARNSLDLGEGCLKAGKVEEGVLHYRRALEESPEFLPALVRLASLLATAEEETVRDGKEAVALAEKACALTRYADPAALGVLAAAHAETGQFNSAVYYAERALEFARGAENDPLEAVLEQQLGLYRQDRPARRSSRRSRDLH
jgi:tetratricopeptide (TPR) repeat protein